MRIANQLTIKACCLLFLIQITLSAQPNDSTVTDYDGNVYHTVQIGNQTWLKENIKSIHYSDGTTIPGVAAYNNDDSLANIYGRLYPWNAAMKNSTNEGTQGVCPCGWHIPSDAEWSELENYLGGFNVAGGKMKETGTTHWKSPNTGATNISGFSALPAGEFDDYYTPHQFLLLEDYAVFWTSTAVGGLKARERYLAYNSTASSALDWYKVMKYSIRCIKDTISTGMQNQGSLIPKSLKLHQNYPNPFNSETTIKFNLSNPSHIEIIIYNIKGQIVKTLLRSFLNSGQFTVKWDGKNNDVFDVSSGLYFYQIQVDDIRKTGKMLLIK